MKTNEPFVSTPSRRQADATCLTVRSILALFVALLLLGWAAPAKAAVTLLLTNKWSLAQGSRYYLPNSGNPRGVALNPATGDILIPSTQGGSNHVAVLDPNGNDLGNLSGSGVTGGTLALDQVGAAADGVVYACNLATAGQGFIIYRWPTEDATGATPPLALALGTPFGASGRVGDSFAVRGSGASTQIIASGRGVSQFVIFTTVDGTNFTTNVFNYPTGLGANQMECGLWFDSANNAVWCTKETGPSAHYVTFNLGALTSVYQGDVSIGNAWAGISVAYMQPFGTNNVRVLTGIYDNGASGPGIHQLQVYDISNTNSPVASTNSAFPTPVGSNGNETGGAAIGNGLIVGFDTANGLQALGMAFQANLPPNIQTAPVGVTNNFPPYMLTVSASGSLPLYYYWKVGTSSGGPFSPIANGTNASYTVSAPGTNYYEVVVSNFVNSVTSTPVAVQLGTALSNAAVTQLWAVTNGAYAFLQNDDATRGLAYDPLTSRLVVANHSTLNILDANTGASLGGMIATNLSSAATFQIDQVGVAGDGAVYAGDLNVAASGNTFILYRWPSVSTSVPYTVAFGPGDPTGFVASGERWGDSMAVRGSGPNTQILLGSYSGTNVLLFTTGDGTNFTPLLIWITNAPTAGFARNGIAFGAGNTLWGKQYTKDLYEIAYDTNALTGGIVFDYAAGSQTPSQLTGLGIDSAHGILAGINPANNPDDLELFQLTGNANGPVVFHQAPFWSLNANANGNGTIAMSYPRVYGLDVNNGIVALTYGVPASTKPSISSPPVGATIYTNDPAFTFSVIAAGTLPLNYQWRYNGVPVSGATSGSYTLHYPPVSASGLYDVVVTNFGGSITSVPAAQLTVVVPLTSPTTVVTQVWTLAAGSRSYLDNSSYNTRGLAYDTNSGSVLVCDHANVYVLSGADGSDLGTLNSAGLPNGGVNGWVLNQIAVADDGVLYSCNLSLDGTGFSIIGWNSVAPGSPPSNYSWGGSTGADPSGGSLDRWGDTLAVRGSGTSTEILLGSYTGTNVLLFTTTDGVTFTPNLIPVTGTPAVPGGFSSLGIAFGAGDTFWAKGGHNYNLRQVSFTRSPWAGTVMNTFNAGTQTPNDLTGLGVDVANNVLGGVCFNDTPNDLQLYLLSGGSPPPALFDQAFFGSVNANSQENAVTVLKNVRAFALDVNNGLVALTYQTPPSLALLPTTFTSVSYQTNSVDLTWESVAGHNYQLQTTTSLKPPSWQNVGPVLNSLGPATSYTDANATNAAQFYRIQVQ